jgi:hypothetical protein
MILAKAKEAANSVSPSQARRSTSAICIHPDTPPPKLRRPMVENNRNSSITPHGGRAIGVSTEASIFAFCRGFAVLPSFGVIIERHAFS